VTDRFGDRIGQPLVFVDTHLHLDDPVFDPDRIRVIERARSSGIGAMVNVGYAPSRWDSTTALARAHHDVVPTLGLHPSHADEFSNGLLMDLESRLSQPEPRAIGEIGLDYSRPTPERKLQQWAFSVQLELASQLRLPVVIHQRAAAADCAAMLSAVSAEQAVVLHSFDGSPELLAMGLDRGWTFGVGGLMTRRSSTALRTALQQVPLDRLVLETDSPYLVPMGIKERRNHPGLIPRIADTLADLLNMPLRDVARCTTDNAMHLFSLEVSSDA
jgi:TatD DNase family protein